MPLLEIFIGIMNTLEISADLVLVDVLAMDYTVKQSLLEESKTIPKNMNQNGKTISKLTC